MGKYSLHVSEYYTIFTVMNKVISEYFGITKFKLDVAIIFLEILQKCSRTFDRHDTSYSY